MWRLWAIRGDYIKTTFYREWGCCCDQLSNSSHSLLSWTGDRSPWPKAGKHPYWCQQPRCDQSDWLWNVTPFWQGNAHYALNVWHPLLHCARSSPGKLHREMWHVEYRSHSIHHALWLSSFQWQWWLNYRQGQKRKLDVSRSGLDGNRRISQRLCQETNGQERWDAFIRRGGSSAPLAPTESPQTIQREACAKVNLKHASFPCK